MGTPNRFKTGALGVLLGAALLAGCAPPPDDLPPPEEPGTVHELLNPSGWALGMSLDGRFVTHADNENVELHDLAAGTVKRLPRETAHTSAVSDDGRYVAFRHHPAGFGSNGPTLTVWDSAAGTAVEAPSLEAPASGSMSTPSMSADGRYVAYSTGNRCNWSCIDLDIYANAFLFDRVTGETVQITDFGLIAEFDPDATEPAPWFTGTGVVDGVHLTGDGATVIYSRTISDPDNPGFEYDDHAVFAWDRASGETTRIAAPEGRATGITASYDGSRVAFQVTELVRAADGGVESSSEVEVVSDTPLDLSSSPLSADEHQGYPHLSADGSMLFFAAGEMVTWLAPTLEPTELVAVDLDGTFNVRREITDTPAQSSVRIVRAVELDDAHAVAYRIFDPAHGYSLHAWQPR